MRSPKPESLAISSEALTRSVISSLATFRLRSPKATLSATLMWGKMAKS